SKEASVTAPVVFAAGQKPDADAFNAALLIGRVVARLFSDSAQSIQENEDVPINFTAADPDLLGGWSDNAPARYTPTIPGWYQLAGGVSMQGGTGITQLQALARLNGSTNVMGSHVAIGTGGVANPSAPIKTSILSMNGVTD